MDWDPATSPALGSSTGPGSWDPEPLVDELSSSCGVCGSNRSMTSTMLTGSTVAAMWSSRGSPGPGATMIGGEVRYFLISSNASSASLV
jgi:hypothetical protein